MKKQQGLTLIEIMIALAIGLFILAATLTLFINTLKSSSDTIKSSRLNHDLGMAMTLMTNDIKRAGYWGGATLGASGLFKNPFSDVGADTIKYFTNLTILNSSATNDCIVYAYDADGNKTVDLNEYYGFRRKVENDIGSIQMRTGFPSAPASINCADDGNWERITDEKTINVTALQFSFVPLTFTLPDGSSRTLNGQSRCFNAASGTTTNAIDCSPTPASGTNIAQKRVVNIVISGQLIGADNAEVRKTLYDTVQVRNNRVYTQ